jgi:hypothetical protein
MDVVTTAYEFDGCGMTVTIFGSGRRDNTHYDTDNIPSVRGALQVFQSLGSSVTI